MQIKFPAISIILRSPISIRIQRYSRPVGRPKGSVKRSTPNNSKQWHMHPWSVAWGVVSAMTQGQPYTSREITRAVEDFNGRTITYHHSVVEVSRLVNKGILVRLRRGLFVLPHSIEEVDGVGVVTHDKYVEPPIPIL